MDRSGLSRGPTSAHAIQCVRLFQSINSLFPLIDQTKTMTTGTLLDDLFEVDPKRAAWYEELARRCEQHGNADTLQRWADPKQRALDLRRMRSKLRLVTVSERVGEDFERKQKWIKTGVTKLDDGAFCPSNISRPS